MAHSSLHSSFIYVLLEHVFTEGHMAQPSARYKRHEGRSEHWPCAGEAYNRPSGWGGGRVPEEGGDQGTLLEEMAFELGLMNMSHV